MPVRRLKKKPLKNQTEIPRSKTVVKTEFERPVLRMFECLVHVENAQRELMQSAIYSGPDVSAMKEHHLNASYHLEALRALYEKYWRSIDNSFEQLNRESC